MIAGIPEETGLSSAVAVSKLLKKVLNLEKHILIDRSHRGLTPNEKPRVIVAKLHYYQDCSEVLRQTREVPLRFKGEPSFQTTPQMSPEHWLLLMMSGICFEADMMFDGIMFPAQLQISYKGDSKEFLDPEKAIAYVKFTIQGEETASESNTTFYFFFFFFFWTFLFFLL